jgi:hypothetical protein
MFRDDYIAGCLTGQFHYVTSATSRWFDDG